MNLSKEALQPCQERYVTLNSLLPLSTSRGSVVGGGVVVTVVFIAILEYEKQKAVEVQIQTRV